MGLRVKVPLKWDPKAFGRSVDVTRKGSNIRKVAKNVALAPAAVPFAVGAGINKATGGKTTTFNVWKAAKPGGSKNVRFSTVTQAASGYQGAVPGKGKQGIPVANRATLKVA